MAEDTRHSSAAALTYMFPPNLCDSSLRAFELLDECYSGMYFRYVDLVGDFAGQEFFLVDGESLLQTVFNEPTLDLGLPMGGPTDTQSTH